MIAGPGAIAYAHDKANRMTNVAGLTQRYDKAGNVTVAYSADRGTSYRYYYDHHNRVTSVHRITGGSEPNWTGTSVVGFKWDALGRRVEYSDFVRNKIFRYFYDGVSELSREDTVDTLYQFYVHGLSYIDEHVMLWRRRAEFNGADILRPYYYILDRMYNVRAIMDRNGGIVERYAYDPYGLPLIRESAGRGDMNNDTVIDTGADQTRFTAALYPGPTVEDWRSDINDDGNRDSGDVAPWAAKEAIWDELTPTVAQAFSDIDNPFMFQGTRHFAIDTGWSDTTAKLPLNHHRARFADPVEGRWVTRDPLDYAGEVASQNVLRVAMLNRYSNLLHEIYERNSYTFLKLTPIKLQDPSGLVTCDATPIPIPWSDRQLPGIPTPPGTHGRCTADQNLQTIQCETTVTCNYFCCDITELFICPGLRTYTHTFICKDTAWFGTNWQWVEIDKTAGDCN